MYPYMLFQNMIDIQMWTAMVKGIYDHTQKPNLEK